MLMKKCCLQDCYREPVDKEFHCHDSVGYSEDVVAWRKLMSAAILCFIFMVSQEHIFFKKDNSKILFFIYLYHFMYVI